MQFSTTKFWREAGTLFLAATMRSWFAVFWNTAFVAIYFVWNATAPVHGRFDPYPYSFLCTMLTAFSYLQGPIIITMAWANEKAQARQEAMQQKQILYQLHMMEAIYVHITGRPLMDGEKAADAPGAGVSREAEER